MSNADPHPAPNVQAGLLLNRYLYEGRGDEFIGVVCDLIKSGSLIVSEEAATNLWSLVRARGDVPKAEVPNGLRKG